MRFEDYAAERVPVMLRTATYLTGDLAAAEDLVQDVLLTMHRRWARIEPLQSRDGYVRRMLVNAFISSRRKWGPVSPVAEVAAYAGEETVASGVDDYADRELLREQIARLPVRQRVVLVLRYYNGLADQQIAEALGCRPGTVRSLASRALAALRVNRTLRAEYTAQSQQALPRTASGRP